jgi:hypothetical protein
MPDKKALTLYDLISLAISLLTLVALVIGLFSLVVINRQTREIATQTKYSAASLQSTAYKAITDQVLEADRLFIEHPKLRPYFYSGVEIGKDNPDYDVVEAMAEYQLDFFDSVQHQLKYRREVFGDIKLETWQRYFDDTFSNSPILCKRLNETATWYEPQAVTRQQAVCLKASEGRRQTTSDSRP